MELLQLLCILVGVSAANAACGSPPAINHTRNNSTGNAPYPTGTNIEYRCLSGFREVGMAMMFVCTGNKWIGEDRKYLCEQINCSFDIQPPVKGKILNNPTYENGTYIEFGCQDGHALIGKSKLTCVDGKWLPDKPPKCEKGLCDDFGDVKNGVTTQRAHNGVSNSIGSVITVTCTGNNVLNGSSQVVCGSGERWEWGPKPTCLPSPCGPYPRSSSCIDYELSILNELHMLVCLKGANVSVTKKGPDSVSCVGNKWTDTTMACYCDCKVNADFTQVNLHNVNDRGYLKHGHTLVWGCKNALATQTDANPEIVCIDGKMSKPECKFHAGIIAGVLLIGICSSILVVLCFIFRTELPCFSRKGLMTLDTESTNRCRSEKESEIGDATEVTSMLRYNKEKDNAVTNDTVDMSKDLISVTTDCIDGTPDPIAVTQ